MPDLPKRGDRVRVTDAKTPSPLRVGDTVTLARDALAYDDDSIHFDFATPRVSGVTWSGPVKVEIIERAGAAIVDDETWINDGCPSLPTVHPEFARGMRTAVEIAEERAKATWLFRDVVSPFVSELREAVEKELK